MKFKYINQLFIIRDNNNKHHAFTVLLSIFISMQRGLFYAENESELILYKIH